MSDSHILRVRGLHKRFRGLVVTDGVSFDVQRRTITSIIGPNGAGKSTLFNMISGYHRPDAGQIDFEGQRIDRLPTHRIANLGVARAFQIARPFRDLSVAENVRVGALFGRSGSRDVEAVTAHALALTDLACLAQKRAGELTVGQLRRLEVGRAVATRASLLLADEPCAGLNPTETGEMIEVLRTVRAEGLTILLVEHDMPSVMKASDHIVVLDAGRKIAEGVPGQVAQDRAVIDAYLGSDGESDALGDDL